MWSKTVLVAILFVVLLFTIPGYVVNAKLYKKAGEPWWTAIVPIYSYVIMAKIARKAAWLGWVTGISWAVLELGRFILGANSPVVSLAGLVFIVLGLYLLNSFIKQYDRGIGAWILYIFLPIIGVFVVDKANYKGGPLPQNPGQPQYGAPAGPAAVNPAAPQSPYAQQPVAPVPVVAPAPGMAAAPVATQQPYPPQPPTQQPPQV